MWQLVYVSSMLGDDESTLAGILESSQRNNTRNHITGMLLYYGGSFMQVLEGEKAAVHETYARICRDPRHQGITIMMDEEVAERQFPQWSMGYRHLRAEDAAQLKALGHSFNFGTQADGIKGRRGLALDMLAMFTQGRL